MAMAFHVDQPANGPFYSWRVKYFWTVQNSYTTTASILWPLYRSSW